MISRQLWSRQVVLINALLTWCGENWSACPTLYIQFHSGRLSAFKSLNKSLFPSLQKKYSVTRFSSTILFHLSISPVHHIYNLKELFKPLHRKTFRESPSDLALSGTATSQTKSCPGQRWVTQTALSELDSAESQQIWHLYFWRRRVFMK